jgi:hypothetical protein
MHTIIDNSSIQKIMHLFELHLIQSFCRLSFALVYVGISAVLYILYVSYMLQEHTVLAKDMPGFFR